MPPSALHTKLHQDPDFGWDPWIGPGTPPTEVPVEEFAAAQTQAIFVGADTIKGDINLLPRGLDVYMSYVDNFGGFPELEAWAAGTDAQLWSITIFGNRAIVADMQPGAMHASDFPGWYDTTADHSLGSPVGYTNAANMAAVISAANGRPFFRWSAHFGFGPHICGPATCGFPQAHWTQWDDKGAHGENIDRSIGTVLLGKPSPPPPPPSKGKVMIASAKNQDGRQEVFAALQSGEIKHIWQNSNGAWNGKAGVTPFFWVNLGSVGGTPIGLSACLNGNNCIEVFVRLDDGSVVHSWQNSPGGGWHGSQSGVNAAWESLGNPGA